jgi:hypothetical protein
MTLTSWRSAKDTSITPIDNYKNILSAVRALRARGIIETIGDFKTGVLFKG